MEQLTERTITTVDAYLAELEKVRKDGYGVDDLEAQGTDVASRCPLRDCPSPPA